MRRLTLAPTVKLSPPFRCHDRRARSTMSVNVAVIDLFEFITRLIG